MSRRMLAVSSSNHCQRSGRNLMDGHAIPGSGLLLTTWHTPTLGFRKQERQLRTGSTGGCLRSIAQRTRSGACSYWICMSVCLSVCMVRYGMVWYGVQLQHLVTDVTSIQLMDLYTAHQQLVTSSSVTSSHQRVAAEMSYQRKAEQLLTDENCFRLILVS